MKTRRLINLVAVSLALMISEAFAQGVTVSSEIPIVIKAVAPNYPSLAVNNGAAGAVVVEVALNNEGAVSSAKIVSGHPLLRDVVKAAASKWLFSPSKELSSDKRTQLIFQFTLLSQEIVSEEDLWPVYNFPNKIEVKANRPPIKVQSTNVGDEREVGGVKLRWCPPGRFVMGSPSNEPEHRPDEAQVEVRLTKGFWMGKYEVTQGQWKRLVGEFPQPQPAGEGDNFPVCWVNYAEAEEFCQKLTELGHKSGELPKDWEFRLPTEAQWEYACRAGSQSATSFGNKLSSKQANFNGGKPYNGAEDGPALKRATPVGSYPANAWGLYDMHGNIFEWCRDWYHTQLPGGDDPDLSTRKGTPNRDGTFSRARRGGAWDDEGKYLRSAFRLRYEPERRADHIGFRVVAVPKINR